MTARQTPAGRRSNPWATIYMHNTWRGSESLSGPGSGTAATRLVAPAIRKLVRRHGFTSVLDAGCGDGWWMPDLPGYVGVDPSPIAVRRAMERHPERTYIEGDVRDLGAGGAGHLDMTADLVILRDVIQHLTLADGIDVLDAAFAIAPFVLASSYRGGANIGCPPDRLMTGWAYDDDLTAPPFSLGEPLETIADGYEWEGEGVRDPRKYLGLWARP